MKAERKVLGRRGGSLGGGRYTRERDGQMSNIEI
jgi:hypothetical protein